MLPLLFALVTCAIQSPLTLPATEGRLPSPKVQTIGAGDRVTVHFVVALPGGKELANTDRRGLPYTFVVGQEPIARPFDAIVRGMTLGDERTVDVPEQEAFGADGVPPIVPAHAALRVRVRVVKVVAKPPPEPPPPGPAGRIQRC